MSSPLVMISDVLANVAARQRYCVLTPPASLPGSTKQIEANEDEHTHGIRRASLQSFNYTVPAVAGRIYQDNKFNLFLQLE